MNEAHARAVWSRFVKAGDLVLDIGAHEGKHAQVFAAMGCRVIAFEPQIGKLPRRDGEYERVEAAVSNEDGSEYLHVDPEHDYLSTLAVDYTERVRQHSPDYFARKRTTGYRVLTYRLDTLIDRFGWPAFIKIDVEGHEREVIEGLTKPVPALSFEVHDFDLDKATECIEMLSELGDYHCYYSRREDFQLEDIAELYASPSIFGDVYAIRAD